MTSKEIDDLLSKATWEKDPLTKSGLFASILAETNIPLVEVLDFEKTRGLIEQAIRLRIAEEKGIVVGVNVACRDLPAGKVTKVTPYGVQVNNDRGLYHPRLLTVIKR